MNVVNRVSTLRNTAGKYNCSLIAFPTYMKSESSMSNILNNEIDFPLFGMDCHHFHPDGIAKPVHFTT